MTPVEQIKEKLDIVDFIKGYIELKPAGKNFKANCPFHGEKTPSFMVSPERQTWHCFGACSEGGDIFKFLMKYENLEFYEALKVLAEKAGVELKRISPQDQKQFGVLYDINESAKDFFKKYLNQHQRARQYLKERGLINQTIEEFEIGMSPNSYDELTLNLINLGYDIKDIERSGLNFKNDRGNYTDRFRNRIMFPIYNHFGKVIGFSGRILPEFDTGEMGKYINSPETLIFNKSRVLFGFYKSKNFIHKQNEAVLVEGQMDFLMLWQDEVKNAIATSGTALTPDHLKAVKRLTENIVFSFDSDEAGLKAAERSIDLANQFDLNVKILVLKDYKDPAEAAQKAPGRIQELIKLAQSAMEFYFNRYLPDADRRGQNTDRDRQDFGEVKKNMRIVLGKIKNLSSAIEKNHWLKELSNRVGIDSHVLEEEMNQLPIAAELYGQAENISDKSALSIPHINSYGAGSISDKPAFTRWELISDRLMVFAAMKDEFRSKIKSHLQYFPENFKNIFVYLIGENKGDNSLKDYCDKLEYRSGLESEKVKEVLDKELDELLFHLESEFLKTKKAALQKIIHEAERQKDEEKLQKTLKEFDEVSKMIQNN